MADRVTQRSGSYQQYNRDYSARNSYDQANNRANYGPVFGMPGRQNNDANLAYLAQGFGAMNISDPAMTPKSRDCGMGATASHNNPMGLNSTLPAGFWGGNAPMMFPATQAYAGTTNTSSPAMYTPTAAQYMAQAYGHGHQNSPLSQNWTPTQASGEIPTLITPRRDSISSNENDAPGTPMYASYSNFAPNGVSIVNRSPSGAYTSTPSPLQMMPGYHSVQQKAPDANSIAPRLKLLVATEPAIPTAVPAPSSPLKPLDRALENIRGETNVYIRGLLPETSDEMLMAYGKRFGDIKSSKSIIDHISGLCKGFGFIRYHNYKDAEDCIRGFHYLGYEVSFARESFYSKLKAIANDDNTNLYVSNLPKEMNEHELASIFVPRKVCSARILRQRDGTGRGVGFARFESRKDCEEIIRDYNNKIINSEGEEYTIQIRYADTQEQKHLKQQTAAARQFRSAEYEYATQAHKNGWVLEDASQFQRNIASNNTAARHANEFDTYLGRTAGVPFQNQRWAHQPAWRQGPQRSPLVKTSASDVNVRQGNSSTTATPMAKTLTQSTAEGGVHVKLEDGDSTADHEEHTPTDSDNEAA